MLGQVFTLREVLLELRGLVGKTKLLAHLAEHPEHQGGPTHRRWGNRIVFYPEDLPRLRGSLECPSRSSAGRARPCSTSAAPSEDKAFSRALKLLDQGGRKKPR